MTWVLLFCCEGICECPADLLLLCFCFQVLCGWAEEYDSDAYVLNKARVTQLDIEILLSLMKGLSVDGKEGGRFKFLGSFGSVTDGVKSKGRMISGTVVCSTGWSGWKVLFCVGMEVLSMAGVIVSVMRNNKYIGSYYYKTYWLGILTQRTVLPYLFYIIQMKTNNFQKLKLNRYFPLTQTILRKVKPNSSCSDTKRLSQR